MVDIYVWVHNYAMQASSLFALSATDVAIPLPYHWNLPLEHATGTYHSSLHALYIRAGWPYGAESGSPDMNKSLQTTAVVEPCSYSYTNCD